MEVYYSDLFFLKMILNCNKKLSKEITAKYICFKFYKPIFYYFEKLNLKEEPKKPFIMEKQKEEFQDEEKGEVI